MAYQMMLPPGSEMPFIWNVSTRVGPTVDCPNRPTDVELVKVFTDVIAKGPFHALRNEARRPPLVVNGTFDAVLGFWIFNTQFSSRFSTLVDGIVSPAKGVFYGPKTAWVIVKFNHTMFVEDKNRWLKLNTDTRLSAELRRELSKTTP